MVLFDSSVPKTLLRMVLQAPASGWCCVGSGFDSSVPKTFLRMVLQAPASVWCCVSQDPALPSGNMLGRGLGSRVSKALLRMVFGTSRLITEGAWIRADREPNRARARACVNSRGFL